MNEPIIFHIDVNSAFLSWTALSRLQQGDSVDLRTIPAIVGGDTSTRHGIVLAKSIPAKAFGITTGEPVVNALRKCPNLVMAAPDNNMYFESSRQLMYHLSDICPDIEQVSIDECYMDYTPIAGNYDSPEEAAAYIRNSVFEKFKFTVNVGISDRKVLAKMASDFEKPDKTHTLYYREIRQKMWPLPVSDLFTCGRSSTGTLHKLGILTIGDLARTDPAILEAHLKSHGRSLWQYANGIDPSTVTVERSEAKGIGNSTTLGNDALTKEEAYKVLLSLCESVGRRLRTSHKLAGQICTEIRYSDFRNVSHQMPLDVPTASVNLLYENACALFDELWDASPIRLLGVRTSKLVPEDEPVQLSLFDFAAPRSEKQKKLDAALDDIRAKYGKDAIKRGRFL